jgi:predicted ATPase
MMFLKIKNIGKIKDAEIRLDGITVLSGEDGAGKSVFSKTLYCFTLAFYKLEESIRSESVADVKESLFRCTRPEDDKRFDDEQLCEETAKKLISTQEGEREDVLAAFFEQRAVKKWNPDARRYFLRIVEQERSLSDEAKKERRLRRVFKREFPNLVFRPGYDAQNAEVSLTIHGNETRVSFGGKGNMEFSHQAAIPEQTIRIDPSLLFHHNVCYPQLLRNRKCVRNTKQEIGDEELQLIQRVIPGEFQTIETTGEICFLREGEDYPVSFSEIPRGFLPFLLLKRSIETDEISKKPFLTFDNPEAYLHPKTQILLARLLVLLQRRFGLTVLLTTDSPYFLHAVEVFCGKCGVAGCCHYYRVENGTAIPLDDKTAPIYQDFALPFQELENIDYS